MAGEGTDCNSAWLLVLSCTMELASKLLVERRSKARPLPRVAAAAAAAAAVEPQRGWRCCSLRVTAEGAQPYDVRDADTHEIRWPADEGLGKRLKRSELAVSHLL